MYFYPRNKYLLITLWKDKEKDGAGTSVILPPGYKESGDNLKVVLLNQASPGSQYEEDQGKFIVVPAHMIEKIKYDDITLCVVPESAVYGVIVDESRK